MKYIILFFCFFNSIFAQNMTLSQCIEKALTNNLQIKDAKLNVELSAINFKQSKYAYLPQVNGSINLSNSYGTSFDQVTFQRINKASRFSNPSVSASLNLFNGFANYYTLKQNEFNLKSTSFSVQVAMNTVVTNLVAAYLQLITDETSLTISKKKQALIQENINRTKILVDAGTRSEIELLNLQAQLATENLSQVMFESGIERDKLTLIQLMDLETMDVTFETPQLASINYLDIVPDAQTIMKAAISNLPEVKQIEMQLEALRFSEKLSFAGRLPSLTLQTGISSSFSSNGGQVQYNPITGAITRLRTAYFEQIDDNFSQFLNVSLNVPIFARWQNMKNIKTARVNKLRTNLNLETTKNTVSKQAQQAQLDAKQAQNKIIALETQVKSLTKVLEMAQEKYNANTMDFYNFQDAVNNKFKAEQDLTTAKYEFLLKIKLLDLYQGKEIKF